jgi:hypothetical protein
MLGMVNINNAISGGSNEPVHETKRQWQDYYRSVSHLLRQVLSFAMVPHHNNFHGS